MQRKVVANEIIFEGIAQIIERGESAVIKTKGASMRPFITGERDSIELKAVEGELRVGDIVLARLSDPVRYVVHRVVELCGDEVVMMGDGNLLYTERCDRGEVIARVNAIIKPNKRVDPNTKTNRLLAKIWGVMLPFRRYLLAIARRL